jgi:hypothetical protein
MPSWYNLYFATFGTAALLRYLETSRRRWLWLAGLCGGLSIVVKVTGLYFIAAGLLLFAFHEQSLSSQAPAASGKRIRLYRPFLIVCLALFLAALHETVWQRPSLATFAHFVLPGSCLAALLLWREYTQTPGADGLRFRSLFSMALPFLAGALIPVGILLLWYAHAGALRSFLQVTFALDPRHIQWMAAGPLSPSPRRVLALAPVVLTFLAASSRSESTRRAADLAAPALLAALLFAAWKSWTLFELVGFSVSLVVPLLAIASLVWLRPASAIPEAQREPALLVVSVAVLCALIQFPFATYSYFNYVAPLIILGALSLASLRRRTPHGGFAMAALAALYMVVAIWLSTPQFRIPKWVGAYREFPMQTLPFRRAGGIRIMPQQARNYARLIPLVQEHALGPFIYAAPDCPEVCFLSGLGNPTGTLYDFLDPDFFDLPARNGRILRMIQSHGVREVVLKDKSFVSGALPAGLRAALDARFPQSARVGDFEVRWRR